MKKILLLISILGLSFSAVGEEYVIKMLNNGVDGMMSFEPGYIKIELGDSVKFEPTDMGHNSQSFYTPEGATAWNGEMNKEVTVTFDKPGIYLYNCLPHRVMAMLGVIQVGEAVNLEAALLAAKKESDALALNKDRLNKYMAMVK